MMLTLRSFDIFDTLVARRCVHPHNIHRAVEAKAGYRGFTEMRVQAESAISAHGEYDLDDIYRAMIVSFGLSEATALYLKTLELTEEFAHFVPIRQHIVEVQPGDILISDMYLPKSFVTRVVREKCDLHFNPIYLSSRGKSCGRAWEVLTGVLRIVEHTGDSHHSDIEMSRRYGVKGRHTAVSQMTSNEALIEELGYRELALAIRAARLALWSPDSAKQMLGCAQIEVNFPLLFLTALLLVNTAARKGWRRLLFSSRDCFFLFLLFERLASRLGLDIVSTYFFTSRIARATPSTSYLNYFNHLCEEGDTAVVDICGTGWSLTRLFEAAGRPEMEMFLLHHINNPDLLKYYRTLGKIGREPTANFITRTGKNSLLEGLNAIEHRMVADMLEANGVFVPAFVDRKTTPRYDELVKFSTKAFALALESTNSISTKEIFHWLSVVRPAHAERIYHLVGELSQAIAEIHAQQVLEDRSIYELLESRLKRSLDH